MDHELRKRGSGSRTFPTHSPRFVWAAGLVFLLILLTLGLRILSPSDIVSRDQSRTVSYTIDIVRNGNLLLASDADGFPATKPPLVNYLSAVLVAPFGPNEWTFMFPSLLAFFATLVLIYLIARDVFVEMPPHPGWLGLTAVEWATLLAVAFYGLSAMALRLAFVARPDMILVFFLTLSFYAANRALASQPSQGAGWAFVFWLAACLAALAKGPIALIPVAYAFLAAKLFHGGWRSALRLRPYIGAPIALASALAWPVAVYTLAPDHFRNILVNQELGGQFEGRWYSGIVTAWQVPFWVISRFLPWSLLLLVAAWFFPWRQWRKHPLAPALLYLVLLTIPFLLVGSRRGDRFAPFFPLVAVVCAWAAVYCWRGQVLLRTSVAAIPAVIVGLTVYFHFLSEQAKDLSGQRMLDFVREVKAKAEGRPLVFCKTDNRGLPVQAFLGVNQRGHYPHEAPESGAWVVAEGPGDQPDALIESRPIPLIEGQRLYVALAASGSAICERNRDRVE
jgi:4-amino-4-deoxy-L-arabinose transferase-like glycosyltransferase